jgi:hypothetical protein
MRINIVVITTIFILTISGLAFAQTEDKGKGTMGDKAGMMEGKGGMIGMMGMMQQMHTNMVASSDGGVIVISGGKLIKYDNQLNVVKQVDLPKSEMDMMGDKGMMDMMKMCQKMTGNGSNSDNKSPAVDADEHAAHHPEQ